MSGSTRRSRRLREQQAHNREPDDASVDSAVGQRQPNSMHVLSYLVALRKGDLVALLEGQAQADMQHRQGWRVSFSYWLDADDAEDTRRLAREVKQAFLDLGASEVEMSENEPVETLTVEPEEDLGDGSRRFIARYGTRPALTIIVRPPGSLTGHRANWSVAGSVEGGDIVGFIATSAHAAFHGVADQLDGDAVSGHEWARLECDLEARGAFEPAAD